ncbi:hypothetical protein NOM01_05830 [Sporolactobacillus sp. STSJ-5]|uniref:hypothetical protein n=1 Tax=Sporolactobacillus sp. STSJ-5 TaxID=2965076 RepID=UPI0021033042|nr:hypothetical protein [Sporolactobacillus sp. STSJ-5]MCQ2009518.1 hypothetical protein [Sporolactobacillus sp. STSJ-5]
MLVDTAYAARQSNKLERLIKQAGFKTIEPSITNIDYLPDRQLDQQLITRLASGVKLRNITTSLLCAPLVMEKPGL